VEHDPRIVPLYVGFSFLGRIAPEETRRFVRDWRLPGGRAYSLADKAAAYIDASQLSSERCVVLVHDERVDALGPVCTSSRRLGQRNCVSGT
jgi:hypothetical protein